MIKLQVLLGSTVFYIYSRHPLYTYMRGYSSSKQTEAHLTIKTETLVLGLILQSNYTTWFMLVVSYMSLITSTVLQR
jgi:hypothetical protein